MKELSGMGALNLRCSRDSIDSWDPCEYLPQPGTCTYQDRLIVQMCDCVDTLGLLLGGIGLPHIMVYVFLQPVGVSQPVVNCRFEPTVGATYS